MMACFTPVLVNSHASPARFGPTHMKENQMNFKRGISIVVMIFLALLLQGCGAGTFLRHPANALYYWPNRSTIIPDRYPSVYAVNGVHHVSNMERTMCRGVVFTEVNGAMALIPIVRDGDRLVADAGFILSTKVEMDDYDNYRVYVRQDMGGYTHVTIPKFAVNQTLGPCFVYTDNAWDTESYVYAAPAPRTNRQNVRLMTYMVPRCGATMLLLPAGTWQGYDFRWMFSGGANPAQIMPDAGAGTITSVVGFQVLLEVHEYASRGPACQSFRP